MLPSFLTTNITITRPCFPFSWAVAGYLIFLARYSISADCPPGKSGISSTTSNTTESFTVALLTGAEGGGGATSFVFCVPFLSCNVATPVIPSGSSGPLASSVCETPCSSGAAIISLANSFVVRATTSMLLIIINRAAKGRNIRYLVLPISLVLRLFIILIRFLSGKTLKLLDKFAAAL